VCHLLYTIFSFPLPFRIEEDSEICKADEIAVDVENNERLREETLRSE
jgi:hypothetical protein